MDFQGDLGSGLCHLCFHKEGGALLFPYLGLHSRYFCTAIQVFGKWAPFLPEGGPDSVRGVEGVGVLCVCWSLVFVVWHMWRLPGWCSYCGG